MMESPTPVVVPPGLVAGSILRLVVRFCHKKFMVVVPFNATFMDVKNEVLRVYRGINPSFAANNDISISELRDYSGCILFDEYQVGWLVRDLTKIIALRPGEEGPCSTISSTPIPSRSCTPISQTTTQEQLLTTPTHTTHSVLHDSSSQKSAGKLSSYLRTTSLDSLSHSSQLFTPCELGDTPTREVTSSAKVPAESTSPLHVPTDVHVGGIQQGDQQTTKARDTRKSTNSMVREDKYSVLGQSYNTSGFDEFKSDDYLMHKGSSLSSAEMSSAKKRDVYSYISSEDDGSSIVNDNARPKIPHRKKKMEGAVPKKCSIQSRIENKTRISTCVPHKKSKLRSGRSTTSREDAGNKRQSSPVLRSVATLRYPGYSSGWSSSDSETSKDNVISTQATNGDQKEKSDDQFSAPSSINSTVSTSSWTSSERESQNGQASNSVMDIQLEPGHSVDSQEHKGDSIGSNHHNDPGVKERESLANIVSALNEQETSANIVSGLNEQESSADIISDLDRQESPSKVVYRQEPLPSVSEGNISSVPSTCGVEDIPDTHESTPFAPDSVDLEMESQIQNDTRESQHLEGQVALHLEVTVIPETQESLTDGTSTEPLVQCPGSPVIPLQNKDPDLLSPLGVPRAVSSARTKTSGVHTSLSDVDSYVLQSVVSDTSEDQTKDHERTKLLRKPKHSTHTDIQSDIGDSSSTAESGGGHSCVRRRKAKLFSRMFGTSHLNKHPYRRASSRTNLESCIGVPRSDSEFVHPSPHQLTGALITCRRRKHLKLRKVRDSAVSKSESDNQKNQQKEIAANEEQSIYSEGKTLLQVKTKQKPSETDSGVSSTNLSEIAQSSNTSDNQQNIESHVMTKKSKSKKRVSREVINISSDSESAAFEPPPFKKRKPRPNYSKPKPSLIDDVYSSAEKSSATKLNVGNLVTTGAEKRTPSILCTPNVSCDLEIPGESTEQPLIDKCMYLNSSDTTVAEENATDEHASHAMQHENVGQLNSSEQNLECTMERELSKKKEGLNDGDKSESSDLSTSDRDKGIKSIDSIELVATKDLDNDMPQRLENDKEKECTSVDKLSVADRSVSSSSNDSIDETKFQRPIGEAATTRSQSNEGSKVVKDRPSSSLSKQKETMNKVKGVTSPEQQLVRKIMSLPPAGGAPDESEEDSSDLESDADSQGTAVLTQQPLGVDTKEQAREISGMSLRSSPRTSSQQKTSQSYKTSLHRPPRFLFSKSTLKKNYSQQHSEFKNPPLKSQGNLQSQSSTASESDSSDDSWSGSEEEPEPPKKTGSLQMLIPKGQQRAKDAGIVVRSNAQAGKTQGQFSSDKPVRIFSLTPSIVNKKRNSPIKRTTAQSPSVSTVFVSKARASGSEKLSYRESSLSQQEVLLAKGGSQKLSELLTDDKLWEDNKS